mgnify:CR=1 FL=1
MSNLVKRTIFGAIFVALIVGSLLLPNIYFFAILFSLFAVLSVREFYAITGADRPTRLCGSIIPLLLFAGVLTPLSWLVYVYQLCVIMLIVSELFKKKNNPLDQWGKLMLGQMFVAIPFSFMMMLYAKQPMLLLALFVIIWTNDTGAYCIGSLLGKHKMFPRVSPAKSWEGFCGGLLLALVAGYIFLSDPFHFTGVDYSLWLSLLLTVIIVLAGTLGDLVESLTKRTLGIKDSGHIIPGHGGMLDRFDSSLLAAPVLYIILMLI